MPDIFDLVGEEATTTDKGTIYDYPASFGEAFGAGVERAVDTNPLALGARALRTFSEDFQARFGGQEDNLVDQKAAEEEIRARGLDLKVPVGGITRYELDMLQYLKQREVRQNTVGARADGVTGVAAGFAGSLAGSFADPINVASNFIPFVSQYRYARWLAQAGESTLARAGVRAGAGAIEGAAGAAVIEPLVYAGATSLQLDYDSVDSFLNVTLGGVMGGGLHTIGGAAIDRFSPESAIDKAYLRSLDSLDAGLRAAFAPERVRRGIFQSAVAAMERGEVFDIEPLFARLVVVERPRTEAKIDELRAQIEATRADTAAPDRVERLEALHQEVAALRASVPPESVATFTTAKGSIYQVHADGTTTRNKAFRPEHGADEQGLQPTTERTLYVTDDDARALATPEGSWRVFEHDDGSLSLITQRQDGQWGVSPSSKNIAAALQPAVGLTPIELWKIDETITGKKGKAYRRVHFGNEIVSIGEAPKKTPRDLGGLIQQSRADRTQEAFDRQFVDDAEATIAQDKARPKDRIEAVKQDEAEFRDVVEEYREAGRVTAEDEKALKQADDMAAWAERRAKAFEAAAGCLETS